MAAKLTIKDVFMQCQNGMQCHAKMMKSLQKQYESMELPEFWSEFSHYLKYSLIVYKREPAVERTIDFVAKFVTMVSVPPPATEAAEEAGDSITDDVELNKLLVQMFDFLLESHSACDRAVRFRCCQLINKILNNLGEDAQIDDDLYDRIYESMLERLRDKCPVVRLHAVMAMARLQDPRDENCPVIKAYLFLINCDPNPEVRCAVLSCIAPSTKTLPAILERTRDVKDTVRKTAYKVMSEKVHIKALSIANRIRLLHDGLTDRTAVVKETCSSKLLQTWLRTFGGNVLDLLGSLDVESSLETCELAVQELLKSSSPEELVEKFDLLDESIMIPLEKLTSESSMYWQTVCKYIHSLGTEAEVHLEKVLPNCVEFCKYIQKKTVEKLFHDLLVADHVGHNLVKYIIPQLCEIRDYSDNLIAKIRVNLNELKEELDKVVNDQDFSRAAEIKQNISELEHERSQILNAAEPEIEEVRTEKASQIDVETVRATALRVIFDLLHLHGLEAIKNDPNEEQKTTGEEQADEEGKADETTNEELNTTNSSNTPGELKDDERSNAASKLIAFLCTFLDSESSDLRTVAAEGLSKLLLSGRVVSSKILSHLLLLWYNPLTEDDTYLRHCLGTFFPIFAFAGRGNQEIVEEAFIPTLKTIMNAPSSSPLAEVNIENVAELLVHLTNSKHLLENQNSEAVIDNPGHDRISATVCNEIISNPDSFNLKLWVKILNQVELSTDNDANVKELVVLAEQMLDIVKDKQCIKSIQKFHSCVKSMLKETIISDDLLSSQASSADGVNQTTTEVLPTKPTEDENTEANDTQNTTNMSMLDETVAEDGTSFFSETKTIKRSRTKGKSQNLNDTTRSKLSSTEEELEKSMTNGRITESVQEKSNGTTKSKKSASEEMDKSITNTENTESEKQNGKRTTKSKKSASDDTNKSVTNSEIIETVQKKQNGTSKSKKSASEDVDNSVTELSAKDGVSEATQEKQNKRQTTRTKKSSTEEKSNSESTNEIETNNKTEEPKQKGKGKQATRSKKSSTEETKKSDSETNGVESMQDKENGKQTKRSKKSSTEETDNSETGSQPTPKGRVRNSTRLSAAAIQTSEKITKSQTRQTTATKGTGDKTKGGKQQVEQLTDTPVTGGGRRSTRSAVTGKSKLIDNADDSDLENSVFASPTPRRGAPRAARNSNIGSTRKNLTNVMQEEETSSKESPRRSTRTLRSVQSADVSKKK
ncbi:hypothetical protein KUTeg_004856 [Tegillarca granosa]|uniref:UVR domain-containing protein n=1 Tax=Tegillarca granosa TaxID=220873 RepID=A0ABQ9FK62_TEGGR|nr:hypothetical protein KUTeg_004856 [Tegillarca granosa]